MATSCLSEFNLSDLPLSESFLYGQASWQKMSEQERQRHLMEMRLKERQMRREGRWEELEQLLGAALQNRELLENLLGASKAEQERRLRERLAKRKERLANGMSEAECDELEREDEEERKKKRNVLKDLQDCYEQEKEELLRSLGQHHDKLSLERQRQAEITRLRREHRRSLLEEQFDAAALVMGLAKTQEAAVEAARKRQEELARQRLAARRGKLRTSADLLKEQVDVPMPEDDDDVVGLQEAVMREIERKHCEERELLMQLFNEDEVTIHQQTATLMTADQREDKLEELRTVRGGWRGSHGQTPQEQITIFKEAAGVRLVVTATNLATEEKDNSETEVQVALLADLQERQETENQGVLHDLSEQNTTNLKELKQMQNSARKHHWYDNVAVVLLGTERARTSPQGSLTSEEQEVVDALDRKYDAIRDKLLLQALQKQFGQKQWAEMSERERQAKLFKLKLQERKLRQEGRYDEAAALLGDLLENQAELEKALGESRSEQKQRLKERLRRKKKLIEERKAQGLSEDEATIEAILDQQEKDEEQEKKKRRNILESLQHHYDDEKAALLAALGKYDSQQEMERQRQLELAHLQRQQRQLEQEDKFDGAALLLNLAKQQELRLQDTMANERERQRALAMERIAARRRRGQVAPSEGSEQNLAANLKAADAEERMQIATESSSQEGLAKLQKAILADVEQRQTKERDVLLELVAAAEATAGYQQTVMNLQSQELKFELEKLRMECSKWQRSSRHQALKQAEAGDGQTQQDRDGYLEQVAHSRVEQFQLLTKAMVLRLAVEKTRLLAERGDLRDEDITEECSISLLADLQQRQQMENVALNTILSEQGEDTLHKVHDTQKMALREGWVDNVTNVVFSLAREDADNRDDAEEAEHSLDRQKIADNLQTEFNKEEDQLKTDLEKRKAAGEKVNTDAELARLRAQQEARKQAMEENLERQQRLLQEKLEARRRAQQNVELQNEAIMELLQTAERQHSFVYEKTQTEKGRQHELMSKRLAARKEARRQAMEKDRLRVSSASSGGSGRATSPKRPSSMDSNAPLGLKREKTVLDVNLSEQQKNEMYMEMVRQQTAHNRRLSLDQRRHEEQLKKRLEHIKTRRQSDAQELFMRAERQKSNLEKAKQDERDRHVSMTKERVARLRYEKTMTMKEKGSHQARKFDEMLSDGETKGMSEDEKMAAAARKVEETLRKEEKKEKKRKTPGDQSQTTTTDDEHDPSAGQGDTKPPLPSKTPPRKPSAQQERLSQLMAEAEKMKLLKQRRQSKKLERHQKQQPKQGQEQRRKSSTSSVDKGNKSDSDDIK